MGCANSLPASVAGGECKVFAAPDYVIRGRAKADQAWIDDNTEAGIAACGWPRPKNRPEAKVAAVVVSPLVAAPQPQPKLHWWQRLGRPKPE